MKKTLLIFYYSLIIGCANASSELTVHGIQIEPKQLKLLVTSNGCTSKRSFQLIWQEQTLEIEKVIPDNCRRLPHRIWVGFDLPDNQLSFTVLNKIAL